MNDQILRLYNKIDRLHERIDVKIRVTQTASTYPREQLDVSEEYSKLTDIFIELLKANTASQSFEQLERITRLATNTQNLLRIVTGYNILVKTFSKVMDYITENKIDTDSVKDVLKELNNEVVLMFNNDEPIDTELLSQKYIDKLV